MDCSPGAIVLIRHPAQNFKNELFVGSDTTTKFMKVSSSSVSGYISIAYTQQGLLQ